MAWGTGQALAVPQPPVYIPRGEPKVPPSCPRLCPLRPAGTSPPTPVGADLMPARPVPPGGRPEAARPCPSARIGHSGPLAAVRAAGSLTPPRARVAGVSPIPFAGAGQGVSPTRPFARRYAAPWLVATSGVRGGGSVHLRLLAGTARISLQGYVAYLLNIWILGPVAPLTGQYSCGGLN